MSEAGTLDLQVSTIQDILNVIGIVTVAFIRRTTFHSIIVQQVSIPTRWVVYRAQDGIGSHWGGIKAPCSKKTYGEEIKMKGG